MNSRAPAGQMRLQKFLSDAGVASRRHAEEYILAGRVLVNDEVVEELPTFIDPSRDRVIVDGRPVRAAPLQYFLVHKPKGVVCSTRDPAGRTRAIDLLPPLKEKLFPVGRLDEDSSGLLLMTNDGELSQQITHPRYGIPKVYRVEARGRVPAEVVEQLRRGIHLAEGKARAAHVEIVRVTNQRSILTITLCEGRNRQIRRMLARLGHPVHSLKRVQIGSLVLRGLPLGAARRVSAAELRALREALAAAAGKSKPRRIGRPRGKVAGRGGGRKTAETKSAPAAARGAGRTRKPRGETPSSEAGPGRRIIT